MSELTDEPDVRVGIEVCDVIIQVLSKGVVSIFEYKNGERFSSLTVPIV